MRIEHFTILKKGSSMFNKIYPTIKSVFKYLIIYPAGENTSLDEKGKVAAMNSLIFISVFVFTLFTVQMYFDENYGRVFWTGRMVIGMIVLFISLKMTRKINLHVSIFMILMTFGCIIFIYTDRNSNFSALLVFTYPLITFFLLGPNKGLIINGLMIIFLFLVMLNINLPNNETWYPLVFSSRYLTAYLMVIATAYAIELIYTNTWKKLEEFALTDKLTNLPNRTYIYQYLNQLIKINERSSNQFSVFFLDLDRFKEINDTLGHKTGDSILITIAERLKNNIRSNDLVARLGGDEFVIIMLDVKDEISPIVLANKLRSVIKESIAIGDTKHYLSLSIGIANYPKDGTLTDDLLKKADFAMYQAKNAGKDCSKFFSQKQDRKLHRKLQIERYLRKGLANNEFRIAMQPKVNTFTGELSGVEALLRWNNPELGKVGPDVFIPIAEESGIIHSLGLWAFHESIRIYKELNIVSSYSFLLSVNLSPIQLQDRNFVSKILEIVEETEIDTDIIEFEITEGLLLKNNSDIYNALNRLTSVGFHLAIDDFGTGYSSLSYLKRFKVNTLKIDKCFIQNMLDDSDYFEIVKVIISMAKIFGLTTVAEGVEGIDELVSLKNLGCDQIQGYYFSKPLEYSEIIDYVKIESSKVQGNQVNILTH